MPGSASPSCGNWPSPGQGVRHERAAPPSGGLPAAAPGAGIQAGVPGPGAAQPARLPGGGRRRHRHRRAGGRLGRAAPRRAAYNTWAHRLGAARGFARYLQTIDPATEIPPPGSGPRSLHGRSPGSGQRPTSAACLPPTRALRPPLRAATHEALFGLLAATGLRLGEAIALDRADADLDERGADHRGTRKFGRSRLVPAAPDRHQRRSRRMRPAGTGYAPARQQHGSSSPPPGRRCAPAWSTTPSPSSPRPWACAPRPAVRGFMI